MNSVTWTLAVNACRLEFESAPGSINRNLKATNAHFCANMLEYLLIDIVKLLQAEVLGHSSTHYQPEGASATVLIGQGDAAMFHLDKSHLAAHTYFEVNEDSSWGSFRCELELSTCGILPVKELLERISAEFEFEVLIIDCKVRGFRRNEKGNLELMAADSRQNTESTSMSTSELQQKCFQVSGFSTLYEARSKTDSHVVLIADSLPEPMKSEWERLLSAR